MRRTTIALTLLMLSCTGRPMGEGRIVGQFASESTDVQPLAPPSARVIDSPESSLAGLSVQLEVWRFPDEPGMPPAFDEVIDEATPDAGGRFAFESIPGVPVEQLHVSWGGQFFVRILQDGAPSVGYGEGATVNYVWDGETLPMSIPIATRFLLPDWFEDPHPFTTPLIGALADRDLLVYLNPDVGLGIFDPVGSTVRFARFPSALDFEWHADRLEVLATADLAVISMMHETPHMPGNSARFLLVDLGPLIAMEGSGVIDLEGVGAEEHPDMLRIIDLPERNAPALEDRIEDWWQSLQPKSFLAEDGRFYHARRGSTFVLDLDEAELVDTFHDGGFLGHYNAELDQLFFDLPGGALVVRSGTTGEVLARPPLAARLLLGVVGVPGESRTLVSYEASAQAGEHRIAFLDETAAILSDEPAGDVLGFTDRNWDPRYEWGTCSSFHYRTPDCPGCATDPPSDIYPPHTVGTPLHWLDYTFDVERGQLIVGDYGFRFAYEDGLFHPMPSTNCAHFVSLSMNDDCQGGVTYDPISSAAVTVSRRAVCVTHLDHPDITVPVLLDRETNLEAGAAAPAVLSGMGTAFVIGANGVTAVHYRNPAAVALPAVRDLREVY